MKYKLIDGVDKVTYALIFDSGDEVMDILKTFANEHSLKASRITAIGAFRKAVLGYYDFSIKDYKKIPVNEQVEVVSLLGDIALYGNDSKVHAHVVLGRSDGMAMGGHLLQATVHPTLEVILTESPGYLQRRMDEATGLALIDVS